VCVLSLSFSIFYIKKIGAQFQDERYSCPSELFKKKIRILDYLCEDHLIINQLCLAVLKRLDLLSIFYFCFYNFQTLMMPISSS